MPALSAAAGVFPEAVRGRSRADAGGCAAAFSFAGFSSFSFFSDSFLAAGAALAGFFAAAAEAGGCSFEAAVECDPREVTGADSGAFLRATVCELALEAANDKHYQTKS